ncbi:MAG: HEAT repeat domain-containing protein [Myxococcales bacterium]
MNAAVVLFAVLFSQSVTRLPTGPSQQLDADKLDTSALVRLLAQPSTPWWKLMRAAEALRERKDLGAKDAAVLHDALAKALDTRPLRLPPGELCKAPRGQPTCELTIDECLPRAGYLALALGHFRGLAAPALPLFERLAEDENTSVSTIALHALARLGSPKAQRIAVARLRHPDWMCRSRATRLLSQLPELDEPSRQALVEAALDGPHETRWYAVDALARRKEAWTLEPLTWALGSQQMVVLLNASRGLGALGSTAAPALPEPRSGGTLLLVGARSRCSEEGDRIDRTQCCRLRTRAVPVAGLLGESRRGGRRWKDGDAEVLVTVGGPRRV